MAEASSATTNRADSATRVQICTSVNRTHAVMPSPPETELAGALALTGARYLDLVEANARSRL
ncbi:MAG: hypothetical protein ACJ788_27345 [Ktedonobacteraceae bacterium]|jgi:hypothetical protein